MAAKVQEKQEQWAQAGQRTVAPTQVIARGLPDIRWEGRLTNSARNTFLNCRRKFEFSYLRRLSPRAPSIPFLVGGLVHEALDRIYKTWEFDEAEERKIASERCETACKEAAITEQQSDKIWEQQAVVMGILRGYAKHYMAKDKKEWKVVQAEGAFKYSLPNGWTAEGKRDLVVTRKKDNALGLVEHKTASRIDAGYVAKLPLDSQILGYANSMKKEFGKLPKFICYNVMKKSGLRRKQAESFDEFTRRIEEEYLGAPTMYFYRETLSFSEKDVQAYEQELIRFSEEMDKTIKSGYFYVNTSHCTAMGICPFLPLCAQGVNKDNLGRYMERANVHAELDGDGEVIE